MLNNDSKSNINELNQLSGSTTNLLESLRVDTIRIEIISQEEIKICELTTLKRVVKLYFESAEIPVLYCVSYLNKEKLSDEEYKFLIEEEIPLGKIFKQFNKAVMIKKINISVTSEINEEIASYLNVKSPKITKKKYDYWIGEREVGQVYEFFNEESLRRV